MKRIVRWSLLALSPGLAAGWLLAILHTIGELGAEGYVAQGMYRSSLLCLLAAVNPWAATLSVLSLSAVAAATVLQLSTTWFRDREGFRFLVAAVAPAVFWFGFEGLVRQGWLHKEPRAVLWISAGCILLIALGMGVFNAERRTRPAGRGVPILAVSLLAAWAGLYGSIAAYDAIALRRGPNIVMVYFDTLRADHLGSYGYSRPTSPNIDRLAQHGVLFTEVVSQAPATYPSVPSALTSTTASSLSSHRVALPPRELTLAEVLRNGGYETVGFSSSAVISRRRTRFSFGGFEQGFELYDDSVMDGTQWNVNWRSPEGVIELALKWLDIPANSERKFFLFLYIMDPHTPYHSPEPYNSLFTKPGFRGEEHVEAGDALFYAQRIRNGERHGLAPEAVRHLVDLYDGEIAYADSQLGRLLDRMTEKRLMENTLFVILSDHGDEFLEHGGFEHCYTLYRELVHVPLILHFPRRLPSSRRIDSLVASLDVAPTILDLAGLSVPRAFQGRSLLELVEKPETKFRDVILTETPYSDAKAVVVEGWKYIRHFGESPPRDPSAGPIPDKELYDLRNDPQEKVNLAESMPELRAKLDAKMLALLSERERQRLLARVPLKFDEDDRARLRALGYVQ